MKAHWFNNHVCKIEEKTIRAFGSGHVGRHRQTGKDPTNCRYQDVIVTRALKHCRLPLICLKDGASCLVSDFFKWSTEENRL
ncbi:MAG: hypothetical protein JSW26_06970, partial [Desulfobacterales bacterium]